MRRWLGLAMTSNAGLFFFGAVQHAGIALGPFHEPRIIPAAIAETLCGVFLASGVAAVLKHAHGGWGFALIANLAALGGVLLGIAALAAGLGPRTASNDLHHRVMLVLIGVSLLLLWFGRPAPHSGRDIS